MADLFFSRDTELYLDFDGTSIFEIPVLAGFSVSQSTNTSEITLTEATLNGVSRRGKALFNDSLSPAEVSFSTYIRPFNAAGAPFVAGETHSLEEVLWALMGGADTYATVTDIFSNTGGNVITPGAGTSAISFANSNIPSFYSGAKLVIGGNSDSGANPEYYELNGFVIDEVTIDFDVEGIATAQWSGRASNITFTPTKPNPTAVESGSIQDTTSFIQNRVSTVSLTSVAATPTRTAFPGEASAGVYNITLTGGSITISNGIEYLTPETLGVVNTPIANIAGTRNISGSINCYIEADTNAGSDENTTHALLQHSLATGAGSALDLVRNEFELLVNIGGTTGNRVQVNIPRAHLEIPQTNFDDVFSLEIPFHGIASSISTADEISLTYAA